MPIFDQDVHDLLDSYHIYNCSVTSTRYKRKIVRTYTENIDSIIVLAKTKHVKKRGSTGRTISNSYKVELFEPLPLRSPSPQLLYPPQEFLPVPTEPPPNSSSPISSNDPRLGPRVDPNNENLAILEGTANTPIDLSSDSSYETDPVTREQYHLARETIDQEFIEEIRRQNRPRS